jgi:prepilin-type processing-associated H-X9-DG protein
VLASFGARAGTGPVPLPGGQGTTWRAGGLVLKPAGDPRVARWTADLYLSLSARRDPCFRVPRPLRSATGDWITQDPVTQDPATEAPVTQDPATEAAAETPAGAWVAWQWLPGEPADWAGRSPLWPRLIAASQAFHAALAGRPAPPWLGADGSPWTTGDQVAWGDRDPGSVLADTPEPLAGQLRDLLAALRPVHLPAQLIHGDLGGNVLFADGEPPAVIDFSPYWRPAGLALAVAAVDAPMWDGADPAILGQLAVQAGYDPADFGQLLARALVYRLVTEVIFRHGDPAGLDLAARAGQPLTSLILDHLTVR